MSDQDVHRGDTGDDLDRRGQTAVVAGIDGADDPDADSGDEAIDATLDQVAAANGDSPAVLTGLERAAAVVKASPDDYVDERGAVRAGDLAALLARELGDAGPVTIPDLRTGSPERARRADPAALAADDLVALAFIVVMQAARLVRVDLKVAMAAVAALNAEQVAWRQVARTLRAMANGAAPQHDVDDAKDTVTDKIHSLGEQGELESLRLQAAMDRLAKLTTALTRLLGAMDEPAAAASVSSE